MQFSPSLIVILIFAFTIPIFTLSKKFDLLKKFSFFKLKKISVNLSIVSKGLVYFLLIGKLYFTLYVLSYIALNQALLSAISALILLGIIIALLYVFWNLKTTNQDLIIKICGVFLISIFSIIFSIFFLIFLKNTFLNLYINKKFLNIFKIFLEYFALSALFSILSFSFAKIISFFLSKVNCVNLQKNKIKEYLYRFFHIANNTPTIFLCFLPYLIFEKFFSSFSLTKNHFIQNFFLIIFIAIFYSIILVHRIIDHHFLTPTSILNKNKTNFFSVFIDTFFQINIIIQFIFFIQNSKTNIFSILINSLKNEDHESIFFIGFLYFIIYGVYFVYQNTLLNKKIYLH